MKRLQEFLTIALTIETINQISIRLIAIVVLCYLAKAIVPLLASWIFAESYRKDNSIQEFSIDLKGGINFTKKKLDKPPKLEKPKNTSDSPNQKFPDK